MTTQQPTVSRYAIIGLRHAVNGPCGARRCEATLRSEIERSHVSDTIHERRLVAAAQRLELAWLEAVVQLARL